VGKYVPAFVAEFIGPFALTFIGGGAILATGGQNLVAIAFAHGLAIALMIAAAGHVSGGHYNPAVTIGLWATGKVETPRAIGYIISQLLGGLAAAAVLSLFAGALGNGLTVASANPAVNGSIGAGTAVLVEAILTFFLMFVIYGVAVDPRGPRAIAPLAIGLTITIDIFAGGALTGAAMNPARWIGTAVVGGAFDNAWVYWVGPIVGALVAAFVQAKVLMKDARQ
jgi:aquaporin TIP